MYDDIKGFESANKIKTRRGLPEAPRPCIALIIEAQPGPDGYPKGSLASYLAALEYRRLGVSDGQAYEFLKEDNQRSKHPLQDTILVKSVKSAYKTAKTHIYGCEPKQNVSDFSLPLSDYCIGHDVCPYYQSLASSKKRKTDPFLLFNSTWAGHMTSNEIITYNAIQFVEKRRGMFPGSRLFVSHREIEAVCGLRLNSVGPTLRKLEKQGLIELKMGEGNCYGRKATEVKRILPTPRPPPFICITFDTLHMYRFCGGSCIDTATHIYIPPS